MPDEHLIAYDKYISAMETSHNEGSSAPGERCKSVVTHCQGGAISIDRLFPIVGVEFQQLVDGVPYL